jgi:erythromycin esterase
MVGTMQPWSANVVPWSRAGGFDRTALAPFLGQLRQVRVVGLGEASHGTKELVEARLDLMRHLVDELGFDRLVLEASSSACDELDDYVLGGSGDRDALLTGLGSAMWDTVEFAAVVDWLREHNASVAPSARVHLLGVDIFNTAVARRRVLERVPGATGVLERVGAGEALGVLGAHARIDRELQRDLHALAAQPETAPVERELASIVQWVDAHLTGEDDVARLDIFARTRMMAENLLRLLGDGAKAAVWAHNFHLSIGFPEVERFTDASAPPNMGRLLRDALGDRYYALGSEVGEGTYLTRRQEADGLGDFATGTAPRAPDGSLPALLAEVAGGDALVDLRDVPADAEPLVIHQLPWALGDPPILYARMSPAAYDGVLYVDRSTSTTPTAGAREAVAARRMH